MSKPLALLFAVIGTLLLASISFFISIRQPWLVLLCSVLALLFIGWGFIVKARIRRKNNPQPPAS